MFFSWSHVNDDVQFEWAATKYNTELTEPEDAWFEGTANAKEAAVKVTLDRSTYPTYWWVRAVRGTYKSAWVKKYVNY
jgi:hypothetical protein